jgi:hypothetical protein
VHAIPFPFRANGRIVCFSTQLRYASALVVRSAVGEPEHEKGAPVAYAVKYVPYHAVYESV